MTPTTLDVKDTILNAKSDHWNGTRTEQIFRKLKAFSSVIYA